MNVANMDLDHVLSAIPRYKRILSWDFVYVFVFSIQRSNSGQMACANSNTSQQKTHRFLSGDRTFLYLDVVKVIKVYTCDEMPPHYMQRCYK